MSTPAAQVRVRLSADGVKDVVNALKSVERQAKSTAGARGLGAINGALRDFKTLLPTIGVGALAFGITSLVKSALSGADALGKLSEKTGATVEDASALVVAGRLVDVSAEQVKASLTKAAIAVGELGAGSKTAARSFAQLGLTAKNFKDLDTGQAFELIAQRVTAIEDPFRRAEAAAAVFGSRLSADLMPLLNEVANQGLANLRQQAADLGLLITGDLAAAADSAGDSFDIIKLQAEGLATAFVSGLAPSIVSAMGDFSKSIQGDGVEEMQKFGRETGRVLRTVMATFRLFGTVTAAIFKKLGNNIGGVFAAAAQGLKGNFREAWSILGDITEQNKRLDAESAPAIKAALDEVIRQAGADAPPLVLKPKIDRSALSAEVAAAMAAADRTAAAGGGKDTSARDTEKAAREAERLAEERRRAEASAGRERFETEQAILELTGQQRDAKIRALDEEIAKRREIFSAAGGPSTGDEAMLERFRALSVSRIDLEANLAKAGQIIEGLSQARQRIEQDVELGILSQYEGQKQVLAIEQERLKTLQAIAAQAMAAAEASGDPQAIADAEALNLQIGQIEVSVAHASDSFARLKEGAEEALHGGLTDVLANLQNFSSVGDIFQSLATSIVSSLQRIAAEMLATYITSQLLRAAMSAFGGGGGGAAPAAASGGLVKAAAGGLIRGPGTGTSDSIPARLSDGEFVVRAKSVAQPGVLEMLRNINAGAAALNMRPRGMPRGYADGGLVGDPAPAKAGAQGGFAGVIGLEPGLVMKQLESESFDRLLVKKLQRNRAALKSILGS